MPAGQRSPLPQVAVAGLLVCLAWTAPAGVGPSAEQIRRLYITATDNSGATVAGLTPADIEVKERGQVRVVKSIGPVAGRTRVVLLVEEFLAPDTDVRRALARFIETAIRGKIDVALITAGNRNTTVVDFSSDVTAHTQGLNQLMRVTAVQAQILFDGFMDALRTLRDTPADRRVLVALSLEAPQASSGDTDQALNALRQGGVLFYAVTVPGSRERPSSGPGSGTGQGTGGGGRRGLGMMTAGSTLDESGRSKLLGDGTRQSGGERVEVNDTAGFIPVLQRFAQEIAGQLEVSYVLPDGVKPDPRVEISAKRRGLRLRAPERLPD